MYDHDAIHDRGRALEDEFFHRVDEQLRTKLRESMEREKKREQLISATGFNDEELLDHLIDGGFRAGNGRRLGAGASGLRCLGRWLSDRA